MNHNHTLQINPWHCEEEPQNLTNSHKTSGREIKQSNQVSFTRQDDFKTRNDTEQCIIKQGPNTEPAQIMGGALNNK